MILRCFLACSLLLVSGCGSERRHVPVYALGERAQVGSLIYNIFDTQWSVGFGEGAAMRAPSNRFLVVRLSIANAGSRDLPVPSMSLVDDDGNLIEEVTSGERLPNWIGSIRTAHPAEALQGNVFFDVQPRHYKLKISDEDSIKFAYVDLPLNFNPEGRAGTL